MNLELPNRLLQLARQAGDVAETVLRPVSRKYDRSEHEYPRELGLLASVMDGMNAGSADGGAGAGRLAGEAQDDVGLRNGSNLAGVVGMLELARGDLGLALSLPRQGLGNAALAAVGTPEQQQRFRGRWLAMAITEPGAGSDSAAIRTTARADGDDYVLNGEKIFVTAGGRCDAVVVWATLDRRRARSAIKSFVVEKEREGIAVERLEKKLGIRASDTAVIRLSDCRVPKENLLGSPAFEVRESFSGAMQTFDNTRPVVAAMALGVARAALDFTRECLGEQGIRPDPLRQLARQPEAAAALERMEADWEGARLLALRAAWLVDNGIANSMEASMAKAKAGRLGTSICMKCMELCGPLGYREAALLEKWVRDAKIVDIFEGTQQIQQLIIARRLLGKSSAELK